MGFLFCDEQHQKGGNIFCTRHIFTWHRLLRRTLIRSEL